jgi:hypothetical protein
MMRIYGERNNLFITEAHRLEVLIGLEDFIVM